MINYSELPGLADPEKDQYFLTSPSKIKIVVQAAGILETDNVVEVGAGVGTVATALPRSASLTLIELDEKLTKYLRMNVSRAKVVNGDGVQLLREGSIKCDVLLSNLPPGPTDSLISILPRIRFRTAVIALSSLGQLRLLDGSFTYSALTTASESDFTPPQPGESILTKVKRTR